MTSPHSNLSNVLVLGLLLYNSLYRKICTDIMIIREYTNQDLPEIIRIWNEVVEEGIAFPQEERRTL